MTLIIHPGLPDAAVLADLGSVEDTRQGRPDDLLVEPQSSSRESDPRRRSVEAMLRLGRMRLRRIRFKRRTRVQEDLLDVLCRLLEPRHRADLLSLLDALWTLSTESGISLRAASRYFADVHGIDVTDRTLSVLWARILETLRDEDPDPDGSGGPARGPRRIRRPATGNPGAPSIQNLGREHGSCQSPADLHKVGPFLSVNAASAGRTGLESTLAPGAVYSPAVQWLESLLVEMYENLRRERVRGLQRSGAPDHRRAAMRLHAAILGLDT